MASNFDATVSAERLPTPPLQTLVYRFLALNKRTNQCHDFADSILGVLKGNDPCADGDSCGKDNAGLLRQFEDGINLADSRLTNLTWKLEQILILLQGECVECPADECSETIYPEKANFLRKGSSAIKTPGY